MNRPVHFEILTDHPEAISAFYGEVLGWQAATWGDPQTYWLVTAGPAEQPGINGGIMHRHFPQAVINTIEVPSLTEALAKVEKAGGKKIHGPMEVNGVGTHAYCADPDGNLFGLLEPVR
jgi:predicted enzyme related to lactoylglutathione lyase